MVDKTRNQPRLFLIIFWRVPAVAYMAGDPRADASLYRLDLNDVNGAGTYLIVAANKQGTDWQDAIFQNAPMQSHNVTRFGRYTKRVITCWD